MGDPRRLKKRYSAPSHPWQKERIEEEIVLTREYGLRNKKEIWKLVTLLSNFKDQAKRLSASNNEQSKIETEQLMKKLKSYGLVEETASFDEVLSLNIKDLMERRLATVLFNKKLAFSVKQARQMITHNHVMVGNKTINSPSYLVKINEEDSVQFNSKSQFKDENHPERQIKKEMEEIKEEVRKIKKQSEKKVVVKEQPKPKKTEAVVKASKESNSKKVEEVKKE